MNNLIKSNSKIEEQFQCWKCLYFPKMPFICVHCRGIQCNSCKIDIRQQGQDRERCFKCKCEQLIQIDLITQLVYSHLQKECEVCLEHHLLQEYQKHMVQCQGLENLMIDYFQSREIFYRVKFIRNSKLMLCENCNQFPIYPLQQYRTNQLRCLNCIHNDSTKQFRQLDEESIQMFNDSLIQCNRCLIKGNYFQMLHHLIQCKLLLISCDCGWLGQKSNQYLQMTDCIKNQIEFQKNQQISDTIFQLLHQDLSLLHIEEYRLGKKRFRLCFEFNLGDIMASEQESSNYFS